MIESAAQKSGDDQQHAACRDLRSHQDLPRDGGAMPLAGGLQRRRQPEQDRGGESRAEGEERDAPIGSGIQPCGKSVSLIRLL
jgi:hypothetical protein